VQGRRQQDGQGQGHGSSRDPEVRLTS
jgi:hypothetical protein